MYLKIALTRSIFSDKCNAPNIISGRDPLHGKVYSPPRSPSWIKGSLLLSKEDVKRGVDGEREGIKGKT